VTKNRLGIAAVVERRPLLLMADELWLNVVVVLINLCPACWSVSIVAGFIGIIIEERGTIDKVCSVVSSKSISTTMNE